MFRPPWHQIGLLKWLIYYISLAFLAPIMLLLFRLRCKGVERIPRQGAFLLLGNHTSMLDPFWGAWRLLRPTRFMASAQLFRFPIIAWPLSAVGGFPKKKFVKDRDSMETLSNFIQKGLPVMLFPEGTRSFDGRPGRVLPGIGRLTQRLQTSLVIARNTTAHLCHPRWARFPRFIPVHLEYDGPFSFPPEATPEEIAALVQEKITIQHDRPAPRGSIGLWMAHGLETWLWACPQCHAIDSLKPGGGLGNTIGCQQCDASWRLDVSCRLHGHGQTEDTDVWTAHDATIAHFGSPPAIDQARLKSSGIILDELGEVGILKRGGTPEPVGAGRIILHTDALSLHTPDGGAVLWSVPLTELVAVSIELANVLQVRTADTLFQIMPTSGSTIKWAHFMRPWCPNLRNK